MIIYNYEYNSKNKYTLIGDSSTSDPSSINESSSDGSGLSSDSDSIKSFLSKNNFNITII